MKANRSIPAAAVIPVLIYPDVREAVAWLSAAFGFAARVRIGENHRAQFRFGARGATDRRSRRVGGRRRARPVSERDRAAAERSAGRGAATTGAAPRSTPPEQLVASGGAPGQAQPGKLEVHHTDVGMSEQIRLVISGTQQLPRHLSRGQQASDTSGRTTAHEIQHAFAAERLTPR